MNNSKEKKFVKLTESDTELTITHAFLGTSRNLYIIEKHFSFVKIITIDQYYNYLSLLALAIELGLKNIIKNTNKLWTEHDLERLFYDADFETNNILSKKFFGSYSESFHHHFIALLKNIKNLYVEARYCYGNSLKYFIDDKYITNENMISFDEIINNNEPVMMLKLFLEELGEYHNFVHKNSVKTININEDLSNQLMDSIKNKFVIQENISILEKTNGT